MSYRILEIKFLDGTPVPPERIQKVADAGPRSPAFYLDLQDWKEDQNIHKQYKKQIKNFPFFGEQQ